MEIEEEIIQEGSDNSSDRRADYWNPEPIIVCPERNLLVFLLERGPPERLSSVDTESKETSTKISGGIYGVPINTYIPIYTAPTHC